MINYIDYGDHFSHTDDSISSLNFLQYSTNEWSRYGDSKFIYMNRLRHDDFEDIFNEDVVEAFFWPEESSVIYFEYELSPYNYELPILVACDAAASTVN